MQNEMRLRRHDGVYRWHLVEGKPVRNLLGLIARWVTVSVDIEERKLAEAYERYLAEA
jgi:PAS domain S-box-containing protein